VNTGNVYILVQKDQQIHNCKSWINTILKEEIVDTTQPSPLRKWVW